MMGCGPAPPPRRGTTPPTLAPAAVQVASRLLKELRVDQLNDLEEALLEAERSIERVAEVGHARAGLRRRPPASGGPPGAPSPLNPNAGRMRADQADIGGLR